MTRIFDVKNDSIILNVKNSETVLDAKDACDTTGSQIYV